MASQGKSPTKKMPQSDLAHIYLQSPVSRPVRSPRLKDLWNEEDLKGGRTLSAITLDSLMAGHSFVNHSDIEFTAPCVAVSSNMLNSLLSPNRGRESAANDKAPGSSRSQSQQGPSNRGQPKRASDQLLASERLCPPQKRSSDSAASYSTTKSISVVAGHCHSGFRGPETPGGRMQGRGESSKDAAEGADNPPEGSTRTLIHRRSAPASASSVDSRWTACMDMARGKSNQTHLRKPAETSEFSVEPVGTKMTSQSITSGLVDGLRAECPDNLTQPLSLQLAFSRLHAGLIMVDAGGPMMITENGITLPVKGSEKEEEVMVMACQLRGYGIWSGGMALGGTLLMGWKGPVPSLLFLWVTDAQAVFLHRALSALSHSSAYSGPSCCFLLLVLNQQLQDLQAALLASLLDLMQYQRGSSSSSPLDWTDGLLLLRTCPPPLNQHLLLQLGQSTMVGSASSDQNRKSKKKRRNRRNSLRSCDQQQLPVRLIQYPVPPCRGTIAVTRDDLACLDKDKFLNDVIIDFYLKFLFLEGVGGPVAGRSHVFSSFFYNQLSRPVEEINALNHHLRHQRVKTWTCHVDIFSKDFLFVPVNQKAHWFLVVVCFPGLEDAHYEESTCAGASERAAGGREAPDCTDLGCHIRFVLKRPCILIMDSLRLSHHESIFRLIRGYLQVEWEVRRQTPRLFTSDNMRSSTCKVRQQDNSNDCGLYLLQYAESFLQNPVVHFELPLCLDTWFPQQRVQQKRQEIKNLILKMHQNQRHGEAK